MQMNEIWVENVLMTFETHSIAVQENCAQLFLVYFPRNRRWRKSSTETPFLLHRNQPKSL